MIDTIVLTMNSDQFIVLDHNKFTPSSQGLFEFPFYNLGKSGVLKCFQNPKKQDALQGYYKPRLTLAKRATAGGGYALSLRIEFSAPKLIFKNNFDELTDKDYLTLKETLSDRLLKMGVQIVPSLLDTTTVSAIHYSKNFHLSNYMTCSMLISRLGKLNLNRRLDLNKTDYRNEGHAIRYHANTYEVVFYDKIKDLQKAQFSEKRAFERDNVTQSHLITEESFLEPSEVLRMEVRFGARSKINSFLKKIGIKADLTFSKLFQQAIAKKVLLHFWLILEEELNFLAMSGQKNEDVFQVICLNNNTKPLKALQVLGAINLIQSVGIRGLRFLLGKIPYGTWRRLKNDIESLSPDADQGISMGKEIRDSLIEFSPLRLHRYNLQSKEGLYERH